MRRLLQSAAVALGWATIAMAAVLEPIVGRPRHMDLYHWAGRAADLFGPVVLLVIVLWGLVTVALVSAETPGRWRAAVWSMLFVLLPWLLLNAADRLLGVPFWFRLPPFHFAILLVLALVVFWRARFQEPFESVVRGGSVVLQVVAFTGAFCLLQMGWLWWSARNLNQPRPLHALSTQATVPGSPKRVIWIIFDELSFQQVYEHRYAGLALPAFDALAAESTVFTHTVPAAEMTERALPSLFMGQPVENVEASSSGQLQLQHTPGGKWSAFDGQDTIFEDALHAGRVNALAGWYNPYCRILPAVLHRCFWTYDVLEPTGEVSMDTFRANLIAVLGSMITGPLTRRLLAPLVELPPMGGTHSELHLKDYRALHTAMQPLLADPGNTFTLLHLPIPHPEGIFDRATGETTTARSSYVDNLALADQTLAEIRKELQQTGQWDSSTLIVMGDHGWRTGWFWRKRRSQWTREDERASGGGQYDTRPVYLVKLAGQHDSQRLDRPFAAARTRDLLRDIMLATVSTPQQLSLWAQGKNAPGR